MVDASYLECTGHGDAGERVRETRIGLEDLLEWGVPVPKLRAGDTGGIEDPGPCLLWLQFMGVSSLLSLAWL